VSKRPNTSSYSQLVSGSAPAQPREQNAEDNLDSLLLQLKEKEEAEKISKPEAKPDAVTLLRKTMVEDLIPVFVELAEKYAAKGIVLEMDASNLIQGGREIKFHLGVGPYRTELLGTATDDAIAFHQVRYTPEVDGELTGGPMIRLRALNAETFRSFVCERLAILLRSALRRK